MKDLTKGTPARIMISFAVPVALGNMFQLCYSLADTRVVGSALGETALAAVGATASISTLFIGFLSGLTNGFSLLIAREFGAGNKEGVKRFAAGSLLLGAVTALSLTLACLAGLPWILGLLNVPQELLIQSDSYIRVILSGLFVTMLYNACASVLRAVGDTTAPLLFLIFAAVLNVVLDLVFIMYFGWGIEGAAFATVLSQGVAACLSLIYMFCRYRIFRFCPADFKISGEQVKKLYASGLSMAAMMSLVFFGTLSLQCAINTFGQDIIVAHTAARKITEFCMLPFSVMGVTMANYCGQNTGAGRMARHPDGNPPIPSSDLDLGRRNDPFKLSHFSPAGFYGYRLPKRDGSQYRSSVSEGQHPVLFCSGCYFYLEKQPSGHGRSCDSHMLQHDRTGWKNHCRLPSGGYF